MDINGGVENPMQQQQLQQQPARRGTGGDNPPPPLHKCPRCDSTHTKFCYYNNYSLSQPRYYCKACRRYWTHGGTLRNVPIGGGSRKNKRGQIRPLPARATPGAVSPLIRPSLPFPTPVIPPATGGGGTFYNTGSSLLSSLAAMQPLTASRGVNLGGGNGNGFGNLNLGGGGGGINGGGQFGGNMALLHGVSLPFKAPMATRQFEQLPPSHYFPTQAPPGFGGNWNQGFGNSGGSTTTSVVTSGVWNCNTGGGGNNLEGSSFTPNHWSNNNQGFN